MNKGSRLRVQIVFTLVFFFGVSVIAFGQDRPLKDDETKKLKEEILTVYETKGEKGLRNLVKEHAEKINSQFIMDFAESGLKKGKVECLNISKIMAEEKKDEKALADVDFKIGQYNALARQLIMFLLRVWMIW